MNKIEEVKLAKKGTIMAKFQEERINAISEMFDNVDKIGIYHTTKLFIRLDKALKVALKEQKEEYKKEFIKWFKSSVAEDIENAIERILK